jgi:hypothetical protein
MLNSALRGPACLPGQPPGQLAQKRGAISLPCGSVHAGQNPRGSDRELFRQFMHTPGLGEVVKRAAHLFTGIKDVFRG